MNIFYLSENPKIAASYHYNKHKVKMIVEAAQMLCTAHHHYNNSENIPYRKTHYNHPSTQWVRESSANYLWTYWYMIHLGNEYKKRYGKIHLTIIKCTVPLKKLPPNIPGKSDYTLHTQPPQAMPNKYQSSNSVDAYWNYYELEKVKIKNNDEEIILRPQLLKK